MRPRITFGFLLKTSINLPFKLSGVNAYKDSPRSPVKVMRTFPVLLCCSIRSDAVSMCLRWVIFDRQDVVLGIDHSFFLKDPRSFLNPGVKASLTVIP